MSIDISISVIIPAFNYAKVLPRAVLSVLEQHEPCVEVVVVDDGSTDDTPIVLEQLQREWPQLIVHRQKNGGAAAARNHGVRVSSGLYLLMLDADDELLPTSIAALKQAVGQFPDAGLVLGGYISVVEDGREREKAATRIGSGSAEKLIERYLLEKRIAISHGCSLFRRDILETCPYPEYLRSSEDIPVFAYALIAAPVLRLDQPVARIYKHAGSLRHQRSGENPQQIVESVFAQLPLSCHKFKSAYYAQRLLSLFRAHAATGEKEVARELYRQALKASPRQALKWIYLRKALRLFC